MKWVNDEGNRQVKGMSEKGKNVEMRVNVDRKVEAKEM